MKTAFAWNLLAFFVWGAVLLWARYATLRREQILAERNALQLMEVA